MLNIILLSDSQNIHDGSSGLGSKSSDVSGDWASTLPESTDFVPVKLSTKSLLILILWGILIFTWTIFIFIQAFEKNQNPNLMMKSIRRLPKKLKHLKAKVRKVIELNELNESNEFKLNQIKLKPMDFKHLDHQNTTNLDCRCMGSQV
ncbi:hypothetical protein DFH28DRAFT_1105477 [Melampsora americana]|nr:hypothetical protein DFH28DRAFT_1105477 [Melampsora americana]